MESLPDILVFDFRELGQALGAIRIQRGNLEHPSHGQAQVPQARLAIELGRVDGNPVKCDKFFGAPALADQTETVRPNDNGCLTRSAG